MATQSTSPLLTLLRLATHPGEYVHFVRTPELDLLSAAGLAAPQRGVAGGVTWAPTRAGMRCLETAGGVLASLRIAQGWMARCERKAEAA